MDVSKNRGTPKSSILIGFSIINHPFWGTPIFWKHPHLLNRKMLLDDWIQNLGSRYKGVKPLNRSSIVVADIASVLAPQMASLYIESWTPRQLVSKRGWMKHAKDNMLPAVFWGIFTMKLLEQKQTYHCVFVGRWLHPWFVFNIYLQRRK